MTLLAILCRELPRNVGCFDDDVFGVNVGCISFFAQENVRTRSPLRTLFSCSKANNCLDFKFFPHYQSPQIACPPLYTVKMVEGTRTLLKDDILIDQV